MNLLRVRQYYVDDGGGHSDTLTEYSTAGPYFEVNDIRAVLEELKRLSPNPKALCAQIDVYLKVCETPSR